MKIFADQFRCMLAPSKVSPKSSMGDWAGLIQEVKNSLDFYQKQQVFYCSYSVYKETKHGVMYMNCKDVLPAFFLHVEASGGMPLTAVS